MGVQLTDSNSLVLDFSSSNYALERINILNTDELSEQIFTLIDEAGVPYGVGGYNEERSVYQRSPLFDSPSGSRFIHLGIDIWAKPGHPVYAPLSGIVHSIDDNAGFGNYGPTIILQHEIEGQEFYSLYGHLAPLNDELFKGKKIRAGEPIAHIGAPPGNGDWPPHLHFQLITDVGEHDGDFPGVTTLAEREKYLKLCPDPNMILRHPSL